MICLRPYQASDAGVIVSWFRDEIAFRKWCGTKYETFPITAKDMNRHYVELSALGGFFPMTAVEGTQIVGHLILRCTDEKRSIIRFGYVVVDEKKRGMGYGKKMLTLAAEYARVRLGAEKITLGVFENNESALRCYRAVGFCPAEAEPKRTVRILDEDWTLWEMELLGR